MISFVLLALIAMLDHLFAGQSVITFEHQHVPYLAARRRQTKGDIHFTPVLLFSSLLLFVFLNHGRHFRFYDKEQKGYLTPVSSVCMSCHMRMSQTRRSCAERTRAATSACTFLCPSIIYPSVLYLSILCHTRTYTCMHATGSACYDEFARYHSVLQSLSTVEEAWTWCLPSREALIGTLTVVCLFVLSSFGCVFVVLVLVFCSNTNKKR